MKNSIPNVSENPLRSEAESNQKPSTESDSSTCSVSFIGGDRDGGYKTIDVPLSQEEEIRYNENHKLPLRELASKILADMPWIEHNLARGLPADYPTDTAKYHDDLCAALRTWKEFGRPTGQKWVDVFYRVLLLGEPSKPQSSC